MRVQPPSKTASTSFQGILKPFLFMNVAQQKSPLESPGAKNPHLTNGFNSPGHSAAVPKLETLACSYLDLGITSSQNTTKSKRRLKKSERLEIRFKSKQKIQEHLRALGKHKEADSMAICGERFTILTCGEHIPAKLSFHRCGFRYCPMCAPRRANKYQKKYFPYAEEFVKRTHTKPCLLTLTQKKIKGERYKEGRARILKSFNNFIRHEFFKEYFSGGIWACETTFSESGAHVHLHLVVFRKKFVDEKLLKQHWAKASPGAKNLNIKLIDDLNSGLRECIKYISKPMPAETLERSHVSEILELKGAQMINTFGEFRKFVREFELPEPEPEQRQKLEAGDCCPSCNKQLFEKTVTTEELIEFHRRVETSYPSVASPRAGPTFARWKTP